MSLKTAFVAWYLFVASCQLLAQSTAQKILLAGERMLHRPYVAGVLNEQGADQTCTIDTLRLDCWTFTEYCLAYALATTETDFAEKVKQLRYRNGQINGYGSRLHYFTEWAKQAEQNTWLVDITQELGGIRDKRQVNYMSKHPTLYPLMKTETDRNAIRQAEHFVSNTRRSYVPKAVVDQIADKIKTGDIIGIVTSTPGLDVAHQGIAVKRNGKIHLMHASTEKRKVVVTTETLGRYLMRHKKHQGIVVLRPN